jgi:hypothetical protein
LVLRRGERIVRRLRCGLSALGVGRIGEKDRKQNLRRRQFLLHDSRRLRGLLHQHLVVGRAGEGHLCGRAPHRVEHRPGHRIEHVISSTAAAWIVEQRGGELVDVAFDVGVQISADRGAANAHSCNRRGDLHVAGMSHLAGNECEGPLHKVDERGVRRAVGIVGELCQHHAGVGAHVEGGTVVETERETGSVTGPHHIALEESVTDLEVVNDAVRVLNGCASAH